MESIKKIIYKVYWQPTFIGRFARKSNQDNTYWAIEFASATIFK